MSANAEPIVAQIRHDMQALMDYVTGPDAASQTAYTVELSLGCGASGCGGWPR